MLEMIKEAINRNDTLYVSIQIMGWILAWVFAIAEGLAAIVIVLCALWKWNGWLLLWLIPLLVLVFFTIYLFVWLTDQ